MENKIIEINTYISEALNNWCHITLTAEVDNWAQYLDYTDADLLNALHILTHVASNKAIKSGHITPDNVASVGRNFKLEVLKAFGFDTIALTNKVLNNGIDT